MRSTAKMTAEAISPEEKEAALHRALTSRTFARSEQLRAFLRYICEAESNGTSSTLTEYRIGVEVLGRPKSYSPGEDSSVRTRAHELRQKLEKLYSTELLDDSIHVIIPKGAYCPVFIRTPPVSEQLAPVPHTEALQLSPKTSSTFRLQTAVLLALTAVIASVATLLISRGSGNAQPAAILREAWLPFAGPDANVLLCAATPLHLVVGPLGHQAYGSPAYPAPPETYPLFRQHRPMPPDKKLGLLFTDNVLGVGTMNAVLATTYTLRLLRSSFQVLPERVATVTALRGRNAVLFGAPVDSEAISRMLESTPLTVAYEPSVKEFVILDRTTGRTIVPDKGPQGEFRDVYGLVTVLNTRESDRRHGMVIFSGITSAGTQGAAEFFSSADSLEHLRTIFARDGLNELPLAYQVVVRCNFSDWLILSYEYASHKILKR